MTPARAPKPPVTLADYYLPAARPKAAPPSVNRIAATNGESRHAVPDKGESKAGLDCSKLVAALKPDGTARRRSSLVYGEALFVAISKARERGCSWQQISDVAFPDERGSDAARTKMIVAFRRMKEQYG